MKYFMPRSAKLLSISGLLVLMPVATSLDAQDPEPNPGETKAELVTIESRIVVSSSMPELVTGLEVPAGWLSESGEDDLGEFLRNVAGISSIRRGPLNLEPTIRGLQEEQVGMFVDGTRSFAAGPARMDSNISHVNPHTVENLQVVKGPYALTWGAGSLAALEVVTFTPELQTRASGLTLDAEYGDNADRADLFGSVWRSRERFSWSLSAGRRSGGDYEGGDGARVPGDYESSNVRVYMAAQATEAVTVTYKGAYQEQSDLDYPGRLLDATYFYHRSNALDFSWTGKGLVSEVYGQIFVNRKDHQMNNDEKPTGQPAPGRIPPFALRIDLPAESNTLGGRFRVRLGAEQFEGTVGLDYYELEQSATRSIFRRDNDFLIFQDTVWPDATIEDLGGYGQLIWRQGPSQVGATVRVDKVDASAGRLSDFFLANTVGDSTQSETNVSAAVSASFETGSPWIIQLGVGRAVRTATALERYSDRFPATKFQLSAEFMGNPGLDPEESLELNLGARAIYGNFLIEVDTFYREIDNYITVLADPSLPRRLPLSPPVVYRYINGDAASFYGGELALLHRASDLFTWRASFSYVRGEDELFDEPALGMAPFKTDLSLRFHPLNGRLWIDLAARITDRQDRVASTRFEQVTPGYTVYDLGAQYTLGRDWTMRFAVDNITDHAYAHHLNSPNPFGGQRILEMGRNIRFGFGYRFGR